jgi:uncharacterized RDD family membrane protein YckC
MQTKTGFETFALIRSVNPMSTEPPTPPQPPPGGWQPPPAPGPYQQAPPPAPGPYQQAPPPYGPASLATGQLSGFWRRFVAYILDGIVVGIAGSIIGAIIAAIVRGSINDTGGYARNGLVSLVIGVIYFGYLWSRNGQTLGYMALGIRLVRADGAPVSFGVAAARYVLIYLSFALCLIPAIVSAFMIGMGSRKQAIHDMIVGTQVVRT